MAWNDGTAVKRQRKNIYLNDYNNYIINMNTIDLYVEVYIHSGRVSTIQHCIPTTIHIIAGLPSTPNQQDDLNVQN